jgi:AAA domain
VDEFSKSEDMNGEGREPAPQEARADTTPEPPADPGHAMSIMELFDAGWGAHMVSVTSPDGVISPSSSLHQEAMGKAPGRLTQAGWTGVDVNSPRFRCHDCATAELWTSWSANVGFVVGDGYVAFDNDEGQALSGIIVAVCVKVLGPRIDLLRRFVRDPRHKRDAFVFRVVEEFIGPVAIRNRTLKFDRAGAKSELQILAQAKQFVASGVHPGTGKPYVLNKRVTSLADIPGITPEQFDQIIEGVIAGMKALGWTLTAGGATGAGSKSAPGAGSEPPDGSADAAFEWVAWILERLPNRDAPAGEETPWDKHLDDYDNYIRVLYAVAGTLGRAPRVDTLALGWANGRAQHKQRAESAWASVANNSDIRSGIGHLKQLAKQFLGNEYIAHGFPDDEWIDAEPGRSTRKFKTLAEFLAEYKPLRYVIGPLVAAEGVYTLTGPTGHAKTSFLVIAALAVVTGHQYLLDLEISAGRVAYLSFENPNDVRMRFGVAAHRLGIDPGVIDKALMILDYRISPEEVAKELKVLSTPENGGPFSLLIVDTLQAAFDGGDFNQNKEVLDFMRRQRRLTRLPGGPCVIIAAHPKKNAERTDLVPYGGGSILNEVDGNLTIWKEEDVISVHWWGKWRGVDFDPRTLELVIADAPAILDTKGRAVRIPVLQPLTAAAKAARDRTRVDTRTALLQAMLAQPDGSQTAWAITIGRDRSQVSRGLKDLAKNGLAAETDGEWSVTKKGQKHVVATVRRRNTADDGKVGEDEHV